MFGVASGYSFRELVATRFVVRSTLDQSAVALAGRR